MMKDCQQTVYRASRYTETETHTQTAEREQKRQKEKPKKQSAVFAKTDTEVKAAPSPGLGMKGSKLLTRQRAWQLRFPEKRQAHDAVRSALRRGLLVKEPCAECGSVDHLDAHHSDYSQPLQVVWLCRRHHARRHARKIVKGPTATRKAQP